MGRREVTARSQGTSPGHLILEPGVSQNPVPVGPRLLQRTEELMGLGAEPASVQSPRAPPRGPLLLPDREGSPCTHPLCLG